MVNDVAAIGRFQNMEILRAGKFILPGGLFDIQADILPERFSRTQSVGVEAHTGAGPSGVRAPVAEVERGGAVHMAGLDKDGCVERTTLVGQLKHIAGLYTEAVRSRGA